MKIKSLSMLLLGAMSIAPLYAHHSTSMFDSTRRVTFEATVKQLEWTSPHAYLQILVTNEQGAVEEWGLEMGTPAAMMREGWKPKSVLPGDKITVVLNPLKNGDHGGNLVSVVKSDGTVVGRAK
ncbi:MAG: DUF6152 family protein [Steroidobacteraceae bacterium]